MTICYHGLPITPNAVFLTLAGKCFCVSHGTTAKSQVGQAHQIGSSVMLDNGAFSKWRSGGTTDWPAFYDWCDPWLDFPTTWAVIPDVIDAGTQEQDALLREWPFGHKGAPVWHMDEPISRLVRLTEEWPKVCIGSTSEYAVIFRMLGPHGWMQLGMKYLVTTSALLMFTCCAVWMLWLRLNILSQARTVRTWVGTITFRIKTQGKWPIDGILPIHRPAGLSKKFSQICLDNPCPS